MQRSWRLCFCPEKSPGAPSGLATLRHVRSSPASGSPESSRPCCKCAVGLRWLRRVPGGLEGGAGARGRDGKSAGWWHPVERSSIPRGPGLASLPSPANLTGPQCSEHPGACLANGGCCHYLVAQSHSIAGLQGSPGPWGCRSRPWAPALSALTPRLPVPCRPPARLPSAPWGGQPPPAARAAPLAADVWPSLREAVVVTGPWCSRPSPSTA